MGKTHPPWKTIAVRFFGSVGPGVIAGAADDDPSGIATYSVAGAQFGTALLWTALLTWPLMAGVQMMCARIGMVTGRGLAGNLRKKFPRPVLVTACLALLIANTINVGADLAGMADVGEMLSGVNAHYLVIIFGSAIAWATIRFRYYHIARVLKWLCLSLFAYVIAAFKVGPHWSQILSQSIIPSLPQSRGAWAMLVGILGTTISPYLFFWQASQEIEEEKASGRKTLAMRTGANRLELIERKLDVGLGTFFSNVVMFFIILMTALTLHDHGVIHIETSRQAAEALRPLAGAFAAELYTMGLLGVGFLAIPTLTGSAAYALAEVFGWRQGLDLTLHKARAFYAVILFSSAAAMAFVFARINPIKLLYFSAILNGLLAPFLLVGILVVASDRKLMNEQPSSRVARVTVLITTLIMFAAGIGMFIF